MSNIEFISPIQGINLGMPADKPIPMTSEYLSNVRAKGWSGRILIVQRPGLDKWGAGTMVGSAEQPVVAMVVVSTVA